METESNHQMTFTDIKRLWHTSRSLARRLTETTVAEMKNKLADIPSECDALPLKSVLSLSAACDVIEEMTRRMAGWPPK